MFKLEQTTEQEIRKYIVAERDRRGEDLGMDICYLIFDTETFNMMVIYNIVSEDKVCGFCVIPKYQLDSLVRLYISPENRRKGLGTFVLDTLKIKRLSCLAENDVGMSFYKNNGFTIEYSWTSNPQAFTFIRE